nr:MAG: ORF1 [Torque teno midi virus]
MPFWWRRRNKRWFGTRWRWRRNKYKRRKPRRRISRRRGRKAPRRRYRRKRFKVRRKKKKLHITQWQPSSIVKCKIKGLTPLVLGADGRQNRCYTDNKLETVYPKTPSGGGFGYEQYTLKYLYSEHQAHNNIWTRSNNYKDLCRYTGCKFTVFRHQTQDFIIQYDIQPPFKQNKWSYMQTHPYLLLLQKHHKVILSKQSNPNGKLTKTIRIKPPKEMQNTWFFQSQFSSQPLLTIKAATTNLNYSYLQCCNENQQLSIHYLDLSLYNFGNWGNAAGYYQPYNTAPTEKKYYCKDVNGKNYEFQLKANTYTDSISYTTGWFAPKFLQAIQLYTSNTYQTPLQDAKPINYCIYNPNLDTGKDNKIFFHSLLSEAYRLPQDDKLSFYNVPLWLGLFGIIDWLTKTQTKDALYLYCIALQSPALQVAAQATASKTVIPIDKVFINGNQFFNQPPTPLQKAKWFPSIHAQLQTINDIVECGPYIPKMTAEKLSTWELKARYAFYFKWGGPQVSDPTVHDPEKQGLYTTASTEQQTIQVCDPEKQKTETMFHDWDIRRGSIKESAFKRMFENLSTTTDVSEIADHPSSPKRQRLLPCLQTEEEKEKEIQVSLHSLFEKSTFQETKDLSELIKQQQQQQNQLKHHIYKLLKDLKYKQNMLQLKTGLLN